MERIQGYFYEIAEKMVKNRNVSETAPLLMLTGKRHKSSGLYLCMLAFLYPEIEDFYVCITFIK